MALFCMLINQNKILIQVVGDNKSEKYKKIFMILM